MNPLKDPQIGEPWLVAFDYSDGGHFQEIVSCSPTEAERINALLASMNALEIIGSDYYVGPTQKEPTPFEEFWETLHSVLGLEEEE